MRRVDLEFVPGDLEVAKPGVLYASEYRGACWWILNPSGFALKTAVCTSHLTYGLAVLQGGSAVLATCRSEDVVHVWRRIAGLLYEELPRSLPLHDISIGDVDVGPDGHIYLCLAAGGMVLELDQQFRVVDALARDLRAPQDVAFSPDGQRAYVLEAPGIGPEFVYVYVRDVD